MTEWLWYAVMWFYYICMVIWWWHMHQWLMIITVSCWKIIHLRTIKDNSLKQSHQSSDESCSHLAPPKHLVTASLLVHTDRHCCTATGVWSWWSDGVCSITRQRMCTLTSTEMTGVCAWRGGNLSDWEAFELNFWAGHARWWFPTIPNLRRHWLDVTSWQSVIRHTVPRGVCRAHHLQTFIWVGEHPYDSHFTHATYSDLSKNVCPNWCLL